MSEPSEFLLQHLPEIRQVLTAVCRRKGMDVDEIEEFAAVVTLRLVENDYAILRAYQGRSTFKTYMTSVVTRMLIDCQRREWGKWRDSAGAERLGGAAVELERLLHRDGHPLEEALSIVGAHHPDLTRTELVDLAEQLAPRSRRQLVALEEAREVRAADDVDRSEKSDTAARISRVVTAFIETLSSHDRLILKLRFDSEMSVTQISNALHLEYQTLWRRLQKHYRQLRQQLERAGIRGTDVEKIVGADVLLDFQLKNCGPVPSEQEESGVAARQEDISS
jgi:RNA polymerase sigma factor (sigma-70 family)